jgi:CRP-like cAMP-binding protein
MAISCAAPPGPKWNQLLAAMPQADYQRLVAQLEPVQLHIGQPLQEPGASLRNAIFPVSSIISMSHAMRDGATAEIALIGNEGMVGIELIMGGAGARASLVVKSAGWGYRLRENVIREQFKRCDSLRHILLRYTHALLTQIAQTAACNRHHSIEQQLCRFLLSCLDRLPSNELRMTQECIANTLGVRRESVTEAARRLQSAGLIHYRRGRIMVVDRTGLESEACECYSAVKHEYDSMRAEHGKEGRIAA